MSVGVGATAGTTFAHGPRGVTGPTDWIGVDGGHRALPDEVRAASEESLLLESDMFSKSGYEASELEHFGEVMADGWARAHGVHRLDARRPGQVATTASTCRPCSTSGWSSGRLTRTTPLLMLAGVQYEQTKAVLASLERESVRYVVFGGVALNLHGLARATEDLDIFIAATAENVDRLKTALAAVFADPSIEDITAADLLGDYPAIQYVPPEGEFHLDILTRLGEAYAFEDIESMRIDFDGVPVDVATPVMLYRMKRDTVRPKDWADAAALARVFDLDENA